MAMCLRATHYGERNVPEGPVVRLSLSIGTANASPMDQRSYIRRAMLSAMFTLVGGGSGQLGPDRLATGGEAVSDEGRPNVAVERKIDLHPGRSRIW